MHKIISSGLLSIALPFSAQAAQLDSFTDLFARTCMQHFYSQDQLRGKLAAQQELEGQEASFFLGGLEGTAWLVEHNNSRFVVSLRQDGMCAVFAQTASATEVQRNFVATVGNAPEPLVAVQRQSSGPASGSTRTVSYAWTREQDPSELLFTLTTSEDPDSPVQAMASLGVAAK